MVPASDATVPGCLVQPLALEEGTGVPEDGDCRVSLWQLGRRRCCMGRLGKAGRCSCRCCCGAGLRTGCRRAPGVCAATFAMVACFCFMLGLLPVLVVLFFPRHLPGELRPEDYGISTEDFQRVTFSSPDTVLGRQLTISAVHFNTAGRAPPRDCSTRALAQRRRLEAFGAYVVVVHGHGSAALHSEGPVSPLTFAVKPLLCAGLNILAVDQRNHGHSSDAAPVSVGWHEANDVLAAVDWLAEARNASRNRIFLWGMSMGAATVGYAAARNAQIRAVAMEAPPVSLGMVLASWIQQASPVRIPIWIVGWLAWWCKVVYTDSPFDHDLLHEARFITADVLLSHGYQDTVVPFSNAVALGSALRARLPQPVDGAARYMTFFHDGGHVSSWSYTEYYEKLFFFYATALMPRNAPHIVLGNSAKIMPWPVKVSGTFEDSAGSVGPSAKGVDVAWGDDDPAVHEASRQGLWATYQLQGGHAAPSLLI